MYLARNRTVAGPRYSLRESVQTKGRFQYRELYDLGMDPSRFIVYPGGNSFHFDQEMVQDLIDQGVSDVDRELELIFMPWLDPEIQRIVLQMTRLGRKKKWRDYSREAMRRAQERLHLFDRRRFFYLRFGRVESLKVITRPHKFLNVLNDMCRDEIENYFRQMEFPLRLREKKQYVYQALNLKSYFRSDITGQFPAGLNAGDLDHAFLTEICRLNQDPEFQASGNGSGPRLSDYLIPYAILWFDYEFGQRPYVNPMTDDFFGQRTRYQPPPPPEYRMDISGACRILCISMEEYQSMDKNDLVRAYRRLAMEHHPDQGGDSEKFIELNEAYERLVTGK